MMKEDQATCTPPFFRASALQSLPGRNLLYAGIASLVLHALAIFSIIAAGFLFPLPAQRETPAAMKVALVSISSFHPSQIRPPEIQARRPESEPGGDRREILFPEGFSERTAAKREMQEKPAETFLSPSPGEVKERFAGATENVAARTGTDLHHSRNETARNASVAEKNVMAGGSIHETPRFTASRYQQSPPPVYPQAARQRGYEGLVLISVEILENGAPGQLLVKKSSGYEILDQAALNAVRKWKFVPAAKNSVRIRSWGDVPIRFVLQDSR